MCCLGGRQLGLFCCCGSLSLVAPCVCLFESTLHLVASSDAMDQKEVGELLRLLNAARHSGVLDTILESMRVPEVAQGSMTDAGKRRKGSSKGEHELRMERS